MTDELTRVLKLFTVPYKGVHIIIDADKFIVFGMSYNRIEDAMAAIDNSYQVLRSTIKT